MAIKLHAKLRSGGPDRLQASLHAAVRPGTMALWIGDRAEFDALPRPLDPARLYCIRG